MQEYKITSFQLSQLEDLLHSGYKISEINTYMGYASIALENSEDDSKNATIIMETV